MDKAFLIVLAIVLAITLAAAVLGRLNGRRARLRHHRRDPLAYSHGDVTGPPPPVADDFKCNTWPRCVQPCGRCGAWG